MILTFIFAMVGCTAHNEPGKNAVVSSSSNAVFDVTQAEDLSEKTEDETVEKSTFAEETTQPPAAVDNGFLRHYGLRRGDAHPW